MNVKLLLDENLSPWVAETLRKDDGLDAVHVRDRRLLRADDGMVLERAFVEDRILVTCNVADFLKLARARELHAGIVLVEDGGLLREGQLRSVRHAIRALDHERDLVNRVLTIGPGGETAFRVIPPAT